MLNLLLQIGVIILVSRVLAWVMRFFGQPQVVGEMMAGIVLGPSVLGLLYHGVWFHMLFPATPGPDPFPFLNMLAQIGVMFFMFLVGLEFDLNALRDQGKPILITGLASLLTPMLCGFLLSGFLYQEFHGTSGGLPIFVLFGGVAMCITAFPVLARIITEHNLQKTSTGGVALACAAFNDAAGWCLLALVLAISTAVGLGKHSPDPILHALMTLVWSVLFAAFMFTVMRRFLRKLQELYSTRGYLSQTVMAGIFLLIVACSFITQWIGIQAIFGAFLLGAAMPAEGRFVRHISEKIEDFSLLFLLPVFFAYTGLRTEIGLLNTPHLWMVCLVVVLVATASKFVASTLAAHFTGMRWRQAGVIGSLMNARGLVELIVLNIGLSLHVLSPQMFTILVVMALLTTFVTTPLMYAIYPPKALRRDEGLDVPQAGPEEQRVLVSASSPLTARGLLQAGVLLLGGESRQIYALHLETPEEHEVRRKSLRTGANPLVIMQRRAVSLGIPVEAVHHVSRNIADDICRNARLYSVDWIVLGGHRGLLTASSSVGGVVQQVLEQAPANVAILIDKGMDNVQRVLVPYLGEVQDAGALLAAERIGRILGVQITILHVVKPHRDTSSQPLGVRGLVDQYMPATTGTERVRMIVTESDAPVEPVIAESANHDLVVIGMAPHWNLKQGLLGRSQSSVAERSACSVMIVQTVGKPVSGERRIAPSVPTPPVSPPVGHP
jgi:Kef-type K+ transport system membrane component KefB/nucleotide-binding universal stress UspA family protein